MWTAAARRENRIRNTEKSGRTATGPDQGRRAGERATHSRGPTIFQPTGCAFPDGCADQMVFPV